MWKPFLRLLGICDIRGHYKGTLTSSYHYEDNPLLPHIKVQLEATVAQNLNGFYVEMKFFSDPMTKNVSSESFSLDGSIQKEPDGRFRVVYFYSNKGNQMHPDHKAVGLTNHEGVCLLKFDPDTRKFTGEYFTHERSSYGKIVMEPAGNHK